ncbi:DDRGK domain-containing protein 1-like [Diadema antillarum]|uniref:DDRGK domain-containing protein 1-like n=1 Tax=Diadema antillarum TaxID=105358 RepID=UPI003A8B7AE6
MSLVDTNLLIACICSAVAVVAAVLLFFIRQKKDTADKPRRPRPVAARARDDGPPVRGRQRRGVRERMQQARQEEESEEDIEEWMQDDDESQENRDSGKKIGAKKARKLEMKAERQRERELMLQEREESRARREMMEEQRKKEAEKDKEEEAKREEEERLKKEEQEKREHEEYLKLKESFVVEEEGHTQVLSEHESQSLLEEFISYIKNMKVVLLEDLGAQFNIRTQEAINRVQELQEQGRLTGVIDDRGKFIYISQEELDAVAKFIRQRGRVSIAELAEASNQLISLNPENEDVYQSKLMSQAV